MLTRLERHFDPALPGDTRADLELLEDRRFSDGAMYLRYRFPTL